MGGKNKKKKSKTSGNGAAAAIAGAVSEAPDAAAEEEGPRALPPVWQPPPKVSQEMQECTDRIYEAVATHLSGVVATHLSGVESSDKPSRGVAKHTGYKELESMGLFSDTKGNLQRELREHKLLMLAKDHSRTLSLKDVGDHNTFLTNVRIELTQRKEALTKRARLISVLLNKTRDSRRLQALQKDMERIRTAEKNFNEDVGAFNAELVWFHSTPTFQKAQEHVEKNFVNLGKHGTQSMYVHRHEVEEDESMSFEEMLEQMKREDANIKLEEAGLRSLNPLS